MKTRKGVGTINKQKKYEEGGGEGRSMRARGPALADQEVHIHTARKRLSLLSIGFHQAKKCS